MGGIALHVGPAESGDSEEVVGGSENIGVQLDAVETPIARTAQAGLNIDEYYKPNE